MPALRQVVRRRPSAWGWVAVASYVVALVAAVTVGVLDATDPASDGLGFVWALLVTFPTNLPLLATPLNTQSNGSAAVLAAFSAAGLVQLLLLFLAVSRARASTRSE